MSQRRANRKNRKKDEPEEKEEQPVEEEPELSGESRHYMITTSVPVSIEEMTSIFMNIKNVELVRATGPGMESAIDMAKAEFKVETWPAVTEGVQKALVRGLGPAPK